MEGKSFERPAERSRDLLEILKNPHEVFDSPKEAAEKEHRDLMEQLLRAGEVHRRSQNAEMIIESEGSSKAPLIQIAWPVDNNTAMLLQLDPIVEGKGPERGVLAYSGIYGVANRGNHGGEWEIDPGKSYTLEQLFGVPEDLRIVVKPTIERWAIGKETSTTLILGENTRTLYMGLGFLFLGHQWMLVGFHEAGHLPNTQDENEAWLKANRLYSRIHKPRKNEIIEQKYLGLFELLKKPTGWYSRKPTIGQIMKYGLVSHYVGGTKIPERWQANATGIMSEFRGVIEDANKAYANMLGR